MAPVNVTKIMIVTDDGDVISGRQSHFATCVNADKFRKAYTGKEKKEND